MPAATSSIKPLCLDERQASMTFCSIFSAPYAPSFGSRCKDGREKNCSSKVNLSGVNGNVIMSGCVDDNPDDEGSEAAGSNTESFSRRVDRKKGSAGAGGQ